VNPLAKKLITLPGEEQFATFLGCLKSIKTENKPQKPRSY